MAPAEHSLTRLESPDETAQRILQNVAYHPIRSLSCTFHAGVLTLDGRLPSFYLKQVAQTAVRGIEGVAQVENRVEVTG